MEKSKIKKCAFIGDDCDFDKAKVKECFDKIVDTLLKNGYNCIAVAKNTLFDGFVLDRLKELNVKNVNIQIIF